MKTLWRVFLPLLPWTLFAVALSMVLHQLGLGWLPWIRERNSNPTAVVMLDGSAFGFVDNGPERKERDGRDQHPREDG